AGRGSPHEPASPLVARDEGAAGGGRADGEGEEATTEGGVARHAIGIRAHRTLTSRPGRGDADRGGSYRGGTGQCAAALRDRPAHCLIPWTVLAHTACHALRRPALGLSRAPGAPAARGASARRGRRSRRRPAGPWRSSRHRG